MILDNGFNFTGTGAGQAISGTVAQNSTNVFDAGIAKRLFGGSGARGPRLTTILSAVGGTTPTFRAQFVGADDAALTLNVITIADTGTTRALVAGDLPLVSELQPAEQLDVKRYYGFIFTQTGTAPTGTVAAQLGESVQSAGLK